MVPLAAVTRVEPPSVGPLSITHDGMFPSATISFNIASGIALGEAVEFIKQARPRSARRRRSKEHSKETRSLSGSIGHSALADPGAHW